MIQNITDEQPKSLQDYSSRLADGGHFLGWQDRNDEHTNWENFFELPEPIESSTPGNPSSRLTDNILQKNGALQQQSDNQTGFVRPLFRFISMRLISVEESKEDYRRVAGQFDLSSSPIDLIGQMSAYRNALFLQVQRQATEAWRINQEIAEVLKVFYYQTGQGVNNLPKVELAEKLRSDRPLVFYEIRQLFDEAIVGGARIENLKSRWIPENIEANCFVSDQLREATAGRLLSLVRSREPILQIAEKLARNILPLETLLEHLLTGKDFSEIDHARRNMPDPWQVAHAFQQRAKYVVYDTEIVALVMAETREYILQHDLRSLRRHVEAIKRIINNKISVNPDPKTIRNWINFYGQQIFRDE